MVIWYLHIMLAIDLMARLARRYVPTILRASMRPYGSSMERRPSCFSGNPYWQRDTCISLPKNSSKGLKNVWMEIGEFFWYNFSMLGHQAGLVVVPGSQGDDYSWIGWHGSILWLHWCRILSHGPWCRIQLGWKKSRNMDIDVKWCKTKHVLMRV